MGNASKGYRPRRKVYKLRFEDDDLAGLVVRVRSVSIGSLLGLTDLAGIDTGDPGPEDLAKLRELFEVFAGALVEWNVEDDQGQPVPATLAGVTAQDLDFVMGVIRTWLQVLTSVPAPLGAPSSGGERSPAPSIPMEALSPSRAS